MLTRKTKAGRRGIKEVRSEGTVGTNLYDLPFDAFISGTDLAPLLGKFSARSRGPTSTRTGIYGELPAYLRWTTDYVETSAVNHSLAMECLRLNLRELRHKKVARDVVPQLADQAKQRRHVEAALGRVVRSTREATNRYRCRAHLALHQIHSWNPIC